VSSEGATGDGAADPAPAGFSASPEGDAYVAARNTGLAEANQQALQVSLADLPFTVANDYAVECVWADYTLDEPEASPLGYEIVVDAWEGLGYNAFALSPDLTERTCPTSDPLACYVDGHGNLVVVGGGSDAALEFFPDLASVVVAGVQMVGD